MTKLAKYDSLEFDLYARNVEEMFCNVYRYIIRDYFVIDKDLASATNGMLNSKGIKKKFTCDLPSYQLAFLLSFGIQDTCLSARKFYESVMNIPKIITNLSKNEPIKLLCLESESLPTVIGVCHVINEIRKMTEFEGEFQYIKIQIRITDGREKWKNLCRRIIKIVNLYFSNVELTLNSVESFLNWSFEEFNNRTKDLDILVIARYYEDDRIFNYNFLRIILNEMKEDSVLFYFDTFNQSYCTNLLQISRTCSFSQLKKCEKMHASFENLGDEEYATDLPVTWDTDYQPIMFSTFIKVKKEPAQTATDSVSYDEPDYTKSKKTDGNNSKNTNLHKNISDSKVTKILTTEQKNITSGEKSAKVKSKQSNDVGKQSKKKNLVNEKKIAESPKKHCFQSNSLRSQANPVSKIKEVKSWTKQSNQSNPRDTPTNVIRGKQKIVASTKPGTSNNSTVETEKASSSKTKKKSNVQKTHEGLSNLISFLNKKANDSKTGNFSCDAVISRKMTD